MEIKEMIIPENWECIIENGVATFKEKKQTPPKSWEEFCERYPIKKGESYIATSSSIYSAYYDFKGRCSKNFCVSKEEAEAFLAFMQLRQLRKAWVGKWEPSYGENFSVILVEKRTNNFRIGYGPYVYNYLMTFPTKEMAVDFLSCFRDLCETAKILL